MDNGLDSPHIVPKHPVDVLIKACYMLLNGSERMRVSGMPKSPGSLESRLTTEGVQAAWAAWTTMASKELLTPNAIRGSEHTKYKRSLMGRFSGYIPQGNFGKVLLIIRCVWATWEKTVVLCFAASTFVVNGVGCFMLSLVGASLEFLDCLARAYLDMHASSID